MSLRASGEPHSTEPLPARAVSYERENEAAAWQAAQLMDQAHLVSVTVVRNFEHTSTSGGLASAQVMWPAMAPPPNLPEIGDIEISSAAAFDMVLPDVVGWSGIRDGVLLGVTGLAATEDALTV